MNDKQKQFQQMAATFKDRCQVKEKDWKRILGLPLAQAVKNPK